MGKQPNMAEKLAATLLMLTDGHGRPLIDREEAKGMSAQQIVGLFEFDHGIHRAIKGTNHPTNLTPRIYAEHRHKTAKIDVPQIAKTKRIARANDEYVNQILRKTGADVQPRPKSRLPSRPFPKRKMRPHYSLATICQRGSPSLNSPFRRGGTFQPSKRSQP